MKDLLETISKQDLREHLNKSWITHDALWFQESIRQVGMETANRINRSASYAMAVVEIKRLQKLLNLPSPNDLEAVKKIITAGIGVTRPDFMKFSVTFLREDLMRWQWENGQCFAYKGVKRMGLLEQYECGIYERVKGWLDGLGIRYEMTPDTTRCRMDETGSCRRDFRLYPTGQDA